MVNCLTLVTHTHFRLGADHKYDQTACGMAVPVAHRAPAMFTESIEETTCPHCLSRMSREAMASPAPVAASPRELVSFLIETCVPNADADALASVFGGRVDPALAARRLNRLHALFPSWESRVVKCLVDGDEAFARFVVTCRDEMGLIAASGTMLTLYEEAVFCFGEGVIERVEPVQDSFEFWANLGIVEVASDTRPAVQAAK